MFTHSTCVCLFLKNPMSFASLFSLNKTKTKCPFVPSVLDSKRKKTDTQQKMSCSTGQLDQKILQSKNESKQPLDLDVDKQDKSKQPLDLDADKQDKSKQPLDLDVDKQDKSKQPLDQTNLQPKNDPVKTKCDALAKPIRKKFTWFSPFVGFELLQECLLHVDVETIDWVASNVWKITNKTMRALTLHHLDRKTRRMVCGPYRPMFQIQSDQKTHKTVCFPSFLNHLFLSQKKIQVVATASEDNPIAFVVPLLPERDQPAAVAVCLASLQKTKSCLLAAGCGRGKTTMALYCAHQLHCGPVLIVTFRDFSAQQWVERIRQTMPDARVAMWSHLQTCPDAQWIVVLAQNLTFDFGKTRIIRGVSEMLDAVQTLIVDEAHHVVSDVSENILYRLFHVQYRIFLTATPEQASFPQLLAAWAGPPSYVSNMDQFKHATVYACFTEIPPAMPIFSEKTDEINFSAMKSKRFTDETRQEWVIQRVLLPLVRQHNRRILYFTEVVAAVHGIAEKLGPKMAATFCESDPPSILPTVVQRPIVLTSYAKAAEALDLPHGPNTAVLDITTTFLKQTAGRVFRGTHSHNTWIVLIGDHGCVFERQHEERVEYIRSQMHCSVEHVDHFDQC